MHQERARAKTLGSFYVDTRPSRGHERLRDLKRSSSVEMFFSTIHHRPTGNPAGAAREESVQRFVIVVRFNRSGLIENVFGDSASLALYLSCRSL